MAENDLEGRGFSGPKKRELKTTLELTKQAVDTVIKALNDENALAELVGLAGEFAKALQDYPTMVPYLFDPDTGEHLRAPAILRIHLQRIVEVLKDRAFIEENKAKKRQAEGVIGLISRETRKAAQIKAKKPKELTEPEIKAVLAFAKTRAVQKETSRQILTGKPHTQEEVEWANKVVTVCVPNILEGKRLEQYLQENFTLPIRT